MSRAIDLQDTLSKTQAIERVFKVLQQGPELDQRQFAANLKRAMDEKKVKIEETQKEEHAKIRDEEERPSEDRYEASDKSEEEPQGPEQEKQSEASPSSEHRLDITA